MAAFERIFGVKSSSIKETCVLLPFLKRSVSEAFGIKTLSKGVLFAAANADKFTLIHTGMGPFFVGDALLYLSETPCRKVILFGSCGSTGLNPTLSVSALVTPRHCYSLESFSEMLSEIKTRWPIYSPDRKLLRKFLGAFKEDVKEVTCATVGSLKLEEERADLFKKKSVDVLDLECSAFFAAARYTGLAALALFYVTDVITDKPFYEPLKPDEKTRLFASMKKAAVIIRTFIEGL
jgi:purine-nucleoside phosphorylase